MGIFSRLFKIGEANAHAALDKLEDPIRMTEQGIRDLKKDLDSSLHAYAEVKAIAIRSKRDATEAKAQATDYEQKAMMLLQRASRGEMDSAEADRLASECLLMKEDAIKRAVQAEADAQRIEGNLVQLDANIKKMKSNIVHYENELKTLTARAKVSEATKKLNRQMANLDSNGTVSMLEKMKTKVDQEEALAEAYGDAANANRSVDDEINAALNSEGARNMKAADALAQLKARMNQ